MYFYILYIFVTLLLQIQLIKKKKHVRQGYPRDRGVFKLLARDPFRKELFVQLPS